LHTLQKADITEDCMNDPLAPDFMHDIWERVAENNTKIYRQVFRTMPDSEVLDWDDYKRFNDYNERFMQSQGLGHSKPKAPKDAPPRSGPPGSAGTDSMITQIIDEKTPKTKGLFANLTNLARPSSKKSNESHPQSHELQEKIGESPASGISRAPTAVPTPDDRPLDEKAFAKEEDANQQKNASSEGPLSLAPQTSKAEPTQPEDSPFDRRRTITIAADHNDAPETTATQSNTTNGAGLQHATSRKGRRRATTKSSARPPIMVEEVMSKEDAEELLNMIQGHLVVFPYDWYVVPRLMLKFATRILIFDFPGSRKKRKAVIGYTLLISLRRWRFTTKSTEGDVLLLQELECFYFPSAFLPRPMMYTTLFACLEIGLSFLGQRRCFCLAFTSPCFALHSANLGCTCIYTTAGF
jgi:phospholipase D1/2